MTVDLDALGCTFGELESDPSTIGFWAAVGADCLGPGGRIG